MSLAFQNHSTVGVDCLLMLLSHPQNFMTADILSGLHTRVSLGLALHPHMVSTCRWTKHLVEGLTQKVCVRR